MVRYARQEKWDRKIKSYSRKNLKYGKFLTKEEYLNYLNSKKWKKKREKFLKYFNYRCFFCKETKWDYTKEKLKDLEVHHRDYKTLGRERINDIIVLCSKHHNQFLKRKG